MSSLPPQRGVSVFCYLCLNACLVFIHSTIAIHPDSSTNGSFATHSLDPSCAVSVISLVSVSGFLLTDIPGCVPLSLVYVAFVNATELIMAVGLVVDYTVHIVHYFLQQVSDQSSATVISKGF